MLADCSFDFFFFLPFIKVHIGILKDEKKKPQGPIIYYIRQ